MTVPTPRSVIRWGAALATATAVAVTIGATTGGPPNPPVGQESQESQEHTGPSQQHPPQGRTESRQIASSVLGRDVKFTLTAVRSKADPLAASVRLRVFTFRSGMWKESDRAMVGEVDGFFWFPLTGRHAVCTFSTASTEPAPVAVSLLITPSIGCSPTANFRVEDGKIVSS